jgi:hypothetical protein
VVLARDYSRELFGDDNWICGYSHCICGLLEVMVKVEKLEKRLIDKSCLENASKKLLDRFQNYGVYFLIAEFW